MSAIASSERIVDAPIDTVFHGFIDFSTWDLWMPKDFRPITGPARELRNDDRFVMAIGRGPGLPSPLTVIRVRPNVEICWKGGIPGALVGEHSFFFSEQDGGTLVRSEEPFSGLLSKGFIGSFVERVATGVGERTLASFASYIEKRPRG